MQLAPGTIVAGQYRCEREIGEGGMGRVVAATHLVLRQRVALKVLIHTTSPRATQRFLREARLAFRLKSPHVTKVLDAGELENGVPYIAMELLDGVDLAQLSKERGPLPAPEACGYIVQACAGIAEAHALGMVHRDVKLANVFLARTPAGPIVKVLDFGCAKAERVGATSVLNATRQDAFLGTPRCMAPEQLASARDVDARADVWSLGVALYTLLAGRPPFDGDTLAALFEQIVQHPTPPIAVSLPVGLADVIDRCLRKRAEERFANAAELASALAPYTRRAPSRAKVVVPLVALASTGLGAAAFFFAFHRAHSPAPHAPAPPPSVTAASADTPSATEVETVTEAPSPAASAPSRVVETVTTAPARTRVSFTAGFPNRSNGYIAMDMESQKAVASVLALSFCGGAHVMECFTFTYDVCKPALETIAFGCRDDADRERCIRVAFYKRFGKDRIHDEACKDFD